MRLFPFREGAAWEAATNSDSPLREASVVLGAVGDFWILYGVMHL